MNEIKKEILTIRKSGYAPNTNKKLRDTCGLLVELSERTRNDEENRNFHNIINEFANYVTENSHTKKAELYRETLLYVYYPKILTSTGYVYNKLYHYHDRIESNDIHQITVMSFFDLLHKYENVKSGFTYYVKKYLVPYTWRNLKIELQYLARTPVRLSINSQALDHIYNGRDSIINSICERATLEEINAAIKKYKNKSRSKHANTICKGIFKNGRTCRDIAKETGLTYHSIYEIKERILIIIAAALNHNKFSGYYVTFSQKNNTRFKIEERTKKIDTMQSIKMCSNCGACLYKKYIPPRELRTLGYIICKKCGNKNYIKSKLN